ncbi:glycoside hydrolase family 9 protein [Phytohabitans flavus]|uniref:glycoside hydrolase family 9 protein n=1 Tax=Phytohabitans flavus TaxID=1076124 RepID=UPI0036269C98
MTAAPAGDARFAVLDQRGRTVHSGRIEASAGAWSAAYGAVHPIDLTAVRTPGVYRLRVSGGVRAESPVFRVDSPKRLFAPLLADTVNFFQVQRDGADVIPGELDRKPSHLTDRRATVYEPPVFTGDGGDVPAAPLQPRAGAGPVDVEGGWFDAGDFVKFTHASAYALTQLLYVQRETGGPRTLRGETAFGLRWLDKMWDGRTLYVQVGIGTGSEEFGFLGDHDVWRLPEADDALEIGPGAGSTRGWARSDQPGLSRQPGPKRAERANKQSPGDEYQFIKYRPVFPAAPAGEKVSPNLAGRVSAAFALAAQLAAERGDKAAARRWLAEGASLYGQARTTDVGELVTAFPHAYYPEDSWQDDMELGATQLALAARALGDPRAGRWVREAAGWARAYLDTQPWDTLNLYDTSALAHADLVPLLRGDALAGELVADLRRQLDSGVAAAADHPFGHAVDVTQFDAATRSFGYAATAHLYRDLTGSREYDAFGTRQRNFALGANAWGTSLMIGAGTTYPQCPQHQVANLAGLPAARWSTGRTARRTSSSSASRTARTRARQTGSTGSPRTTGRTRATSTTYGPGRARSRRSTSPRRRRSPSRSRSSLLPS